MAEPSAPAWTATLAWARAAAVAATALALDQIAKAAAVASLAPGESAKFFIGVELTHVRNRGIAFGALGEGGPLVVMLVAASMVLLLVYFARTVRRPLLWLPVGAIVGGALGNLADRARLGQVIDFIDPVFWPAFNLADSFIVLGVLGLLYLGTGPDSRVRAGT